MTTNAILVASGILLVVSLLGLWAAVKLMKVSQAVNEVLESLTKKEEEK